MKLSMKKIASIGVLVVGIGLLAGWQLTSISSAQEKTGPGTENPNGVSVSEELTQPQTAEAKRQIRVEKNINALMGRAREKGRVRVIVHPTFDLKVIRGQVDPDVTKDRHRRIASARDTLVSRLRTFARSELKTYDNAPFVVFEADEYSLLMLKSQPDIEAIEEDVAFDPDLYQSTVLIGAPGAWNKGYSGAGQYIVIADTGVDKNHPFLQNKVAKEACFSSNFSIFHSVCPNGMDKQEGAGAAAPPATNISGYYHGTHVAGIAAGRDGGAGYFTFSGVARDARIIALQVFSRIDDQELCGNRPAPCLRSQNSDLQAAMIWVMDTAENYEIASMNMSLGAGAFDANCDGDGDWFGLAFYASQLKQLGIAPVAASGNDGNKSAISAPACISSVVSVGSTSKADVVATDSNSAPLLDLLAPGVSIYSSIPGGGYGYLSGTSMATPHVAGAFAVLKTKAHGADVNTLLSYLKSTGKQVTDTNSLSRPRINLGAAIDKICPMTISPGSLSADGLGGTYQFNVTVAGYCNAWKPTTNSWWIQIVSPTTFTHGSGVVKFKLKPYVISPYDDQKTRTGTIYVGDKQFKITQVSES